jgi:hypothetical protein
MSSFEKSEEIHPGTVLTALGVNSTCIDLSWNYDKTTIYWPGGESFQLCMQCITDSSTGDHYAAGTFTSAEHGGTHVDGKSYNFSYYPTIQYYLSAVSYVTVTTYNIFQHLGILRRME